jgi:hypothetical protein
MPDTDQTAQSIADPAHRRPLSDSPRRPDTAGPPHDSPPARRRAGPDPGSTATVTAVIAVLPEDLPDLLLTAAALPSIHGITGTASVRFWTIRRLRPRQRRALIAPAAGVPAACAGGPLRLLDLDATGRGAALAANVGYRHWAEAVRGTRGATPWPVFRARHDGDPQRYPLARAQAEFRSQPRVQAMRLCTAAGTVVLDPAELEAFQAGPVAYRAYRALTAVCADTLLTADGTALAPASDSLDDRTTYLHDATRHLAGLAAHHRILALAV